MSQEKPGGIGGRGGGPCGQHMNSRSPFFRKHRSDLTLFPTNRKATAEQTKPHLHLASESPKTYWWKAIEECLRRDFNVKVEGFII